MIKVRVWHISVVLILALLILTIAACGSGISKSKYQILENELAAARTNADLLQSQLTQSQAELASTRAQVSNLNQQITALQSQLNLYKASGITVQSGIQPNYIAGLDKPIKLVSNPKATNPTWQQLQTFINQDKTDEMEYVLDVQVCGNFAQDVYNNAEAAGIRAAFVALHFTDNSEPHALNAFVTTDRGLVYIDCTGGGLLFTRGNSLGPPNYDKVAYVKVGKELGFITLSSSVPLTYQGYESEREKFDNYNSQVTSYNNDVASYNQYVAGRVFIIGTPEYNYVRSWSQRLDQEKANLAAAESSLKTVWQPVGVVSNVEIYW